MTDSVPWVGWREAGSGGVSREWVGGEAVKQHPCHPLVSLDPFTSMTHGVRPSTCSSSKPHVPLCPGQGPKHAGTGGTPCWLSQHSPGGSHMAHEGILGTCRRKCERTQKWTLVLGGLVGGWGFTSQSSHLYLPF